MIDDVATDSSTSSEKSRTSSPSRRARRVRMTGKERREQLLDIGRALFADKGFEGTSVEEIA
ncbi:helix-turn-helix transcriptional regulator, partial [Streptomyces sp. SID7499]|nr:helix-turn-helix transcriptional regulator [Streptomyces sp. SID7499]